LLAELGALNGEGCITEEGRKLRALPLPPRLARMVVDAGAVSADTGSLAANIALVLTERGLGGNDIDLRHRLDELARDRSRRADEARRMAARWVDALKPSPESGGISIGALLALAYPDRIARNRGSGSSFLLTNGRGASVDAASPLAREPFLAVAEIAGSATQSRIVLAAPISLAEIEQEFADRIETAEEISFDASSISLRGRSVRRLGAITLAERPQPVAASDDAAQKLAEGIAKTGLDRLPWSKPLAQWRERVQFLRRAEGEEWPDLSDAGLSAHIADWLTPALAGKTALADLSADELSAALAALLPYALRRRLDAEAPTHFTAPSGSSVPIDYGAEEGAKLSIRVQELFGLDRHPTIAAGRVPLVVELLSPAHRPVQVTRDLPGFWRGSYATVRTEMRGRYPRHPWPDDPLSAPATRRAKPRGT
jgi:ATP-dependent helicase HrpB